ncbi:MBL fold metallo-hydrolase [Vibrio crassostreae]|uniref:MBL fold metallo-hydrolase n=1 Tax=Vibrio crassostreae TaxID=246167 RepID=UPI001B305DEB|nr:MBL fold metallo-hydrolase [Vibrio crassostreae]
MRFKKTIITAAILAGVVGGTVMYADSRAKFENTHVKYETSLLEMADIIVTFAKSDPELRQPQQPREIVELTTDIIESNKDKDALYKLGHSTVLFQFKDTLILSDPVFGNRASPVQFAGPERFDPTPITIEALPNVSAVIYTHDHYDHLHYGDLMKLKDKVGKFYAPTGVDERLIRWGVPESQVVGLSWGEKASVNEGVDVTLVESQHYSGRTLTDRNSTLWGGWVVEADGKRVYLSGDTGYTQEIFTNIGDKYNNEFDVALIESGAYNERWHDIHLLPSETVEVFKDITGGESDTRLIPIHQQTFDLALHTFDEPLESLKKELSKEGIDEALDTPLFGQPYYF